MSDLVRRAEAFARDRHAGQLRKGVTAEPYAVHLEEVAAMVAAYGADETVVAAAWLHDVVEDCPSTSHEEVAAEFGADVAGLVREVTDDKALPKAERKRLQIVNAARKSPGAALIKLADKTSNLRALAVSPPPDWDFERRMGYLAWASEVVAALPSRPEIPLRAFLEAREAAAAKTRAAFGRPGRSSDAADPEVRLRSFDPD